MRKQSLSSRITTPFDLGADEVKYWENLSSSVPALASPFLSPHFAKAVAEAGRNVRVCVIYEGDEIQGFFPYQFKTKFAALTKAAEPVGAGMGDYVGVVAAPELRISSRELLGLARLNYFSFSHLDETQLAYGLSAEQPRLGLRIRLRGIEEFQATRSKYLKDSERRLRQLQDQLGPIQFTFDVQGKARDTLLDELIGQKRAQYRRTNVPDALNEPWKVRLLHRLSDYRFDSCKGVLSTMSAGGQWIASHFGIVGNGVLQYWFPVYNPEVARYAPGRLLIHHIMDAAVATAIHTIDRGEGDTASKRELANEEHRFYRGVWDNRSVASHIAHGWQSFKWRLGV
jgi:CelD/BcsL family acetyltransferase involved in cellulose biosynthesis